VRTERTRISRKPGASPQEWAPFKDYRCRLIWSARAASSRAPKTAAARWSRVPSAVLTDGVAAVEAACVEALGDGAHSADVVLNILAAVATLRR
jgi:hypothetical protein